MIENPSYRNGGGTLGHFCSTTHLLASGQLLEALAVGLDVTGTQRGTIRLVERDLGL